MSARRRAAVILTWLIATGPTVSGQTPDEFRPATQAVLNDPDPADWPMWRRMYNGWGYSPLDHAARIRVSVSAWRSTKRWRVWRLIAGSTQNRLFHSG